MSDRKTSGEVLDTLPRHAQKKGLVSMSTQSYTIQIDPDQVFAGLVLVEAYDAQTKRTDQNARLYVTVTGGLEVHLEAGVYPIRAAYDLYSGKNMRVESDDFDVVDGDDEQPRLEYKAVYLHVPKMAFMAAVDFAKSISTPPTTFAVNEVSVWNLPISIWGIQYTGEL